MDIIFRGNIVLFSTTFYDAHGQIVGPTSASVHIRTAPQGAASETFDLVMTATGDVWSVEWDTSDVAPGLVYWSVKAVGPAADDDGTFMLTANWANVT